MFLLKSQDDGFGSANLGIFKPRQMRLLLSIKTVVPRRGGKVWYDDQRDAHRQIYQGEETVDYAFMGTDPEAADNRWLREAYEHQVPVIYFLGVSPGRYQAMFPTFISGWNPAALKASISFGLPDRIDFAAPPQARGAPVRPAGRQAAPAPRFVPRRRHRRIRRALRSLGTARAPPTRCRAHRFRQGRAAGPTGSRPTACRYPRSDPYVVVGTKESSYLTDLQKPWRRVRKAAELEDVRLHDLRHSSASFNYRLAA